MTLYVAPESAGQGTAMAECQVLASVTTSDLAIILTAGVAGAAARQAA